MHYKHMYPSFTWIINNATAFEEIREEKRRAPTFFPAPSVYWMPPNGKRRSRVFFGPPSPYYPYCRRAPRPRTPKLRAVEKKDDVPTLDLNNNSLEPDTLNEKPAVNDPCDAQVATKTVVPIAETGCGTSAGSIDEQIVEPAVAA